jgi:hypothetical protein
MSKIWYKLHQASTQEEMGSWNSGFKKIAEMMPTAFRRDVAGFDRVFTSPRDADLRAGWLCSSGRNRPGLARRDFTTV